MAAKGRAIGTPMEFCQAYHDDEKILSTYQVDSPEDRFIDAAYARTISFENTFYLKDTLASGGERDYFIIFHMDF